MLRVMTLNIVHATRVPLPPRLVWRTVVKRNLDRIAQLLGREEPDVLALQEADGGGAVDRVRYLARAAKFSSWFHDGARGNGTTQRHGAALISRLGLADAASDAFATGFTDDKGWVVATLAVPAFAGREVNVVSVHLDPYREKTRQRQIRDLVAGLGAERARAGRPLIVLGDLNCRWRGELEGVGLLAAELGLHGHKVTRDEPSYAWAGVRRRLDWILVSPELQFARHRTLPERLSDHRAVVADLRLAKPAGRRRSIRGAPERL
ncbi:MAG: endonuclease/exonuclease/phosphatase family protein [Myxococcaceae bacterium]